MRSQQHATARRFERLSRMPDYDVDRRAPDPRGWTVANREGRAVGEVKDLIVDTERMTARYLDVELDTKLFDLVDDDPHVLVPIERARADGKRLVLDEISPEWVSELAAARRRHVEEFWDRWWHGDDTRARDASERPTVVRRRGAADEDLQRVIEDVRPGESVRIPVVNEEIVVERRQVGREVVMNRADDEPPRRR